MNSKLPFFPLFPFGNKNRANFLKFFFFIINTLSKCSMGITKAHSSHCGALYFISR